MKAVLEYTLKTLWMDVLILALKLAYIMMKLNHLPLNL